MFGMALRAYIRKVQRLEESSTEPGRSLWAAVYELLKAKPMVVRREVLEHFHHDEATLVRSMLHDLTESGLVFSTGTGDETAYRTATDDEIAHMRVKARADDLLWAIVFTEGPVSLERLEGLGGVSRQDLHAALDRLVESGALVRSMTGRTTSFTAPRLVVPLGARSGWEAAIYDHFHAVVATICQKLAREPSSDASDAIGGSTFTYEVWKVHPYEHEVRGALSRIRQEHGDLRTRVRTFNDANEGPDVRDRVVVYAGQSVTEQREGELNE
jgi:hypothetical protein